MGAMAETMDISSCLKWLSTEIPVLLQWLAWFIGIAAVVGGGMTLLRRIFEKPKLELHLGNANTHLTCTILNIPIKHKLLRLIGLKRRTDNINIVYYIGKRGDSAIIFCDKPFSGYRPLPASTYEGLSFDIKPTRRDSWFDKKEKPLNDGAYTILFEVDHDNNNKWSEPLRLDT
jgi:hypothetical protein